MAKAYCDCKYPDIIPRYAFAKSSPGAAKDVILLRIGRHGMASVKEAQGLLRNSGLFGAISTAYQALMIWGIGRLKQCV